MSASPLPFIIISVNPFAKRKSEQNRLILQDDIILFLIWLQHIATPLFHFATCYVNHACSMCNFNAYVYSLLYLYVSTGVPLFHVSTNVLYVYSRFSWCFPHVPHLCFGLHVKIKFNYAKPLIEEDIKNWQKKSEFEKQSEWKKRVTAVNQNLKVKELTKEYKSKYLNTNKRADLRYVLAAYDPENETFPVYIKNVDTLFIKVPIAQAPTFKEKWRNDVKITPNYDIVNDRAAIVSFSFKLGNNVYKSLNNYVPDQNLSANIDLPEIIVDVADNKVQTTPQSLQKAKTQPVAIIDRTIDKDIPVSSVNSSNTFAFIIGNENYQNVASVPFAVNDAKIFSEYCHKTLGLPKENIKVYIDATYGKILGALSTLKQISQAYKGDINVIFYYAGHGVPNEKNNEAYLLPADATPSMLEACLPLSGLYSSIGSIDAKQVIVFMDACFSGSRRENGMIVSARGVAIKPKKDIVTGNVVVFSAADGSETAYPYKEKGHGLFTYFLLKKLKESRGNVTLGDLADYVKTNVSQKSIVVNNKSQTPTISSSAQMQDVWRTMKLFRK